MIPVARNMERSSAAVVSLFLNHVWLGMVVAEGLTPLRPQLHRGMEAGGEYADAGDSEIGQCFRPELGMVGVFGESVGSVDDCEAQYVCIYGGRLTVREIGEGVDEFDDQARNHIILKWPGGQQLQQTVWSTRWRVGAYFFTVAATFISSHSGVRCFGMSTSLAMSAHPRRQRRAGVDRVFEENP